MSASYLYVKTHNAAAVPCCALHCGCEETSEETSKETCFAEVEVPSKKVFKKEKM